MEGLKKLAHILAIGSPAIQERESESHLINAGERNRGCVRGILKCLCCRMFRAFGSDLLSTAGANSDYEIKLSFVTL